MTHSRDSTSVGREATILDTLEKVIETSVLIVWYELQHLGHKVLVQIHNIFQRP